MYNIAIEIDLDDDRIYVASTSGHDYSYGVNTMEGADLLAKVFDSDVQATVYSEGKEYTLEEYEAAKQF